MVALVITVIILLILAGISIASLTGSGLFEKARLAKERTEEREKEEEQILGDYQNKLSEYVGGTRNGNPKTILYPNGGTAENPATITTNQRIEIDNPYPGHTLYLIAQIYYNGMWGETGYIFSYGSNGSYGTRATQIQGNGIDKIVVQSGSKYVVTGSVNAGNGFGVINALTEAPFRVIAVCLD